MRIRRWAPVLVAAAALALPALGLAGCGDDGGSGAAGRDLQAFVREQPLDVSQVTLPEADGGTFTMAAEPGKVLVTFFGYTSCPDVCPTTLADLRNALKDLGDRGQDVEFAFVTVDPKRDTPPVLDGYLGSFLPAGQFHALRTDDPAALERAEAAFLASSTVTEKPDGTVEVGHTGTVFAVDDQGAVVAEWPFGSGWRTLAHDLEILVDRARQPTGP